MSDSPGAWPRPSPIADDHGQGSLRDDTEPGGALALVGLDRAPALAAGRGTAPAGVAARCPELAAIARVWAARIGRRPEALCSVGDAPNWTARAEGLKRFCAGRAVNADPWRLFPAWLRDQLPVPPGDATPKAAPAGVPGCPANAPADLGRSPRPRRQSRVGCTARCGLKPWIHRRLPTAAKLPPQTDLTALDRVSGRPHRSARPGVAGRRDRLRPRPRRALVGHSRRTTISMRVHLAALMKGRGVVVATCGDERRRHAAALKLRETCVAQHHDPRLGRPPRSGQVRQLRRCRGRLPRARASATGAGIPMRASSLTAEQLPDAGQSPAPIARGGQHGRATRRHARLHRRDDHPLRDHRRRERVPRGLIPSSSCSRFRIRSTTRRPRGTVQIWPHVSRLRRALYCAVYAAASMRGD